jgi:hypothetical protein
MLSKNFEYTGHLPYFFQIFLADQRRAAVLHRLAQREALAAHHAVAQAFVRHAAFVRRLGGGREPALVDAAAVRPVGIGVVRMQLEAQAGLEEGARHPGRRQAQQASRAGEFGFDLRLRVALMVFS